jgi:hypothetical protein
MTDAEITEFCLDRRYRPVVEKLAAFVATVGSGWIQFNFAKNKEGQGIYRGGKFEDNFGAE